VTELIWTLDTEFYFYHFAVQVILYCICIWPYY